MDYAGTASAASWVSVDRRWKLPVLIVILAAIAAGPAGGTAQASGMPVSRSILEKLDDRHTTQAVLVLADDRKGFTGRLALIDKVDGEWRTSMAGIPVVAGRNGINKQKEGDGKTPTGIFPLGTAFGSGPAPEGLKVPYASVTDRDYWIDDPSSPFYNRWVQAADQADAPWKSFERLNHPLYKLAMVIRYNDNPVVKNKGSAIFMHVWRGPDKPTAGCVAMAEADLLAVIEKLDVSRSPHIVIVPVNS